MRDKIFIVMDLEIKRVDTTVEFIYCFLERAKIEGITVTYILPVPPSLLVKERLKDVDFNFIVIGNWWNKKDPEKRNNCVIAWEAWKILRKQDDCIVEFDFCIELSAFIIAILSKIHGKNNRFVWRQHSMSGGNKEAFLPGLIKKHFSKMRILSLVMDVICPVFYGQEKMFLERGIKSNKIKTLYNGVDIARFDILFDEDGLKNELKLDKTMKVVTTIASLIPRKGLEYFLKAASLVIEKVPNTRFIIVGEGALYENLRLLTEQLNINPYVLFLGKRDDINKILKISDIFALSSLAEPFGLVNIEAMTARKPVVATNVGGIPEIVEDGENGFLVPPADEHKLSEKIISLLKDERLCRLMGEKGRKTVETKFSLDQMVNKYFSLIYSLQNA